MPWPENHIPKYRKHRKSGQAVVTIHGKDHYLGPHGTKASKLLYDRLIAEWLGGGRIMPTAPGDEALTVATLLSDYLTFAEGYYVKNGEPTNEQDAIRAVMKDVRRLYGDTPANEFGPRALKAIRQVWIDRGHKRTTINKNMRRLTRIFRWGVEEQMVRGSALEELRAVPGLKKGRCAAPEPAPILPVDEAMGVI